MRKALFDLEIFKNRRQHLAEQIKNEALIIAAHPNYIRNNDVRHAYRTDSNLFYLTGFEEPEVIFVFRPGEELESVLFVREKHPEHETWDGFRFGIEGTKNSFQVDAVYNIDDFEDLAVDMLIDIERLHYSFDLNKEVDDRLCKVFESIRQRRNRSGLRNMTISDAYPLLGNMRLIKDEMEIETLKKAAEISCHAHIEMMKSCRPGILEMELHGVFLKEIMSRGAKREGYGSIVAAGANATVLHYVSNDDICQDGDLILIDAGGEYNYYTADITRTFPVNGVFNETQKRVYSKILDLQKYIIKLVEPGISRDKLQDTAVDLLVDVMLEEKLLSGEKRSLIETKAYRKYYPHGIGHFLGLDVHDAGTYKVKGEPRPLEPGVCLTIEPGLYVPAHDMEAPKELRGLGIRIEDNILVTKEGREVLTESSPKEIKDIETLMAR